MPKGYNIFSTLNPQQQQMFSQLSRSLGQRGGAISEQPTFQAGETYLQQILGGETGAFEAPYMRQFNEQIIPGLAERFSGLGSGAQRSSAFQQALGAAGADLTERLASLRGQLQMQALPQALGYAQAPAGQFQDLLGLNTQGIMPKRLNAWQQALVGLGSGLGSALGMGVTGGFGSLGSFGSGAKNIFSRMRGIDPDIQALINYIG